MTCTNAVQVVRPDGSRFISLDPIDVLDVRYRRDHGYSLHPITGRHSAYGFTTDTPEETR